MSNLTALPSRAHRPAALLTLALCGLLAACNPSGGATPPPSSPPTNAPTPAVPTPSPTPVPSPTFRADQIEHPTDANDIVLRMEQGGGHMIFGISFSQAPEFTLYGDGTVIFQQIDNRGAPFGASAYLPWLVGRLDEEGMQALLQFALSTGRLANAKDNYENNMCADCGTVVFNLNAGGLEKVVNIYALMEMSEPGPDGADRAGFSQLRAALLDFQNQEGLGDVTEYDAELYRLTVMETFGAPVGAPLEWPWDDLTLADFPAGDEPGGIKILDREHVDKLLEVPNGGHFGVWVEDPDGTPIQIAVRPLLPDEQAAAEAN